MTQLSIRELRTFLRPSTIVEIILDLDNSEKELLIECPTEQSLVPILRDVKFELISYLEVKNNIHFEIAPADGGLRVVARAERPQGVVEHAE